MGDSQKQGASSDDAGCAELLRPATEGEHHGGLIGTLSILRACSTGSRHAHNRLRVLRDVQNVYSKMERLAFGQITKLASTSALKSSS